MWGETLEVPRGEGQKPLNILLFDTEGFEATGKADAYDDRIFALSTVLSAVLIYNLPETVRESDMQARSTFLAPSKRYAPRNVTNSISWYANTDHRYFG
jgi:hypothetical protein